MLIAGPKYKEMLIKARSDHSKFNDMVKGLKGMVVVSRMRQDFELPLLFKEVKSKLPIFTEGPLIELDVLMKELSDASVPKDDAWKEVFKVGARVLIRSSGPGSASEMSVKHKYVKIVRYLILLLSIIKFRSYRRSFRDSMMLACYL